MIIKIGKKKYACKSETGTTQAGRPMVRVTSAEAPVAHNGFTLFSDDESIVFDCSEYTALYRQEGDVKEYTTIAEEIIPTECYTTGIPDGPIDRLRRQISRLSSAVSHNAANITELDDALCEFSTDVDERVGEVEDALCELSEDEEV